MNKKSAFLSVVYSLGQITLGLLLHPYQTMQSLVREKVFIWMSLLPAGVWVIAIVLWRLVIVPLVSMFFSCKTSGFVGCDFLPFLSSWLTWFCFYWQLMLVYLLVRFLRAFSKS